MAEWRVKSESDTDIVWAEYTRTGKETGRYKYAFQDGHTETINPHVSKRRAGAAVAGAVALPAVAVAVGLPPVALAAAAVAGVAVVVGAFRKTIR